MRSSWLIRSAPLPIGVAAGRTHFLSRLWCTEWYCAANLEARVLTITLQGIMTSLNRLSTHRTGAS